MVIFLRARIGVFTGSNKNYFVFEEIIRNVPSPTRLPTKINRTKYAEVTSKKCLTLSRLLRPATVPAPAENACESFKRYNTVKSSRQAA